MSGRARRSRGRHGARSAGRCQRLRTRPGTMAPAHHGTLTARARQALTSLGCLFLRVVNVNVLPALPGAVTRTTIFVPAGSLRFLKRLASGLESVDFVKLLVFVLNAHALDLPFGAVQVTVSEEPAGSFLAVSVVTRVDA